MDDVYHHRDFNAAKIVARPSARPSIWRAALIAGAAPLGILSGGLLFDRLAASAVIGISALACIATGVSGLLSPTLRRIQRLRNEP